MECDYSRIDTPVWHRHNDCRNSVAEKCVLPIEKVYFFRGGNNVGMRKEQRLGQHGGAPLLCPQHHRGRYLDDPLTTVRIFVLFLTLPNLLEHLIVLQGQ
eukprot:scaffold2742_cov167-Amphora_coffeaeformis.AAC.6